MADSASIEAPSPEEAAACESSIYLSADATSLQARGLDRETPRSHDASPRHPATPPLARSPKAQPEDTSPPANAIPSTLREEGKIRPVAASSPAHNCKCRDSLLPAHAEIALPTERPAELRAWSRGSQCVSTSRSSASLDSQPTGYAGPLFPGKGSPIPMGSSRAYHTHAPVFHPSTKVPPSFRVVSKEQPKPNAHPSLSPTRCDLIPVSHSTARPPAHPDPPGGKSAETFTWSPHQAAITLSPERPILLTPNLLPSFPVKHKAASKKPSKSTRRPLSPTFHSPPLGCPAPPLPMQWADPPLHSPLPPIPSLPKDLPAMASGSEILLEVEASLESILGNDADITPWSIAGSPAHTPSSREQQHTAGGGGRVGGEGDGRGERGVEARERAPSTDHLSPGSLHRHFHPSRPKLFSFVRPGARREERVGWREGAHPHLGEESARQAEAYLQAMSPAVKKAMTQGSELLLSPSLPARKVHGSLSLPLLQASTSLSYVTYGPRIAKPTPPPKLASSLPLLSSSDQTLKMDPPLLEQAPGVAFPPLSRASVGELAEIDPATQEAYLSASRKEGIASHSQLIAHILKPQHTPPKEGEAEAVEPAMLFSPTKLRQNRLRRTRKKGSPSRLKTVVKEKVMANNESRMLANVGQSIVRRKHVVDALRRDANLQQLSDIQLAMLAHAGKPMTLPRYSVLYREGASASCFFVLMRGKLSLTHASESRETSAPAQVTPEVKICIGTEAFAGALRRPMTVTAVTEVELICFVTEELTLDASSSSALADRVFIASVRHALMVAVVFQHLPKSVLGELACACSYEKWEPDRPIFVEGHKAECLYVLIQGTVSVFMKGARVTRLPESDDDESLGHPLFGLDVLTAGGVRSTSVITTTPCDTLCIHYRYLSRLLATHVDLRQQLHDFAEIQRTQWHMKYLAVQEFGIQSDATMKQVLDERIAEKMFDPERYEEFVEASVKVQSAGRGYITRQKVREVYGYSSPTSFWTRMTGSKPS